MADDNSHPDNAEWHIGALVEDRAKLTEEILLFLFSLEGKGYAPDTIGRVLGPIFGTYIRDHYAGNPRFKTKEKILEGLPATMKPELIDDFVQKIRAAL